MSISVIPTIRITNPTTAAAAAAITTCLPCSTANLSLVALKERQSTQGCGQRAYSSGCVSLASCAPQAELLLYHTGQEVVQGLLF
jgi:hypothetical protein